jgi:hypothetical protein
MPTRAVQQRSHPANQQLVVRHRPPHQVLRAFARLLTNSFSDYRKRVYAPLAGGHLQPGDATAAQRAYVAARNSERQLKNALRRITAYGRPTTLQQDLRALTVRLRHIASELHRHHIPTREIQTTNLVIAAISAQAAQAGINIDPHTPRRHKARRKAGGVRNR